MNRISVGGVGAGTARGINPKYDGMQKKQCSLQEENSDWGGYLIGFQGLYGGGGGGNIGPRAEGRAEGEEASCLGGSPGALGSCTAEPGTFWPRRWTPAVEI